MDVQHTALDLPEASHFALLGAPEVMALLTDLATDLVADPGTAHVSGRGGA